MAGFLDVQDQWQACVPFASNSDRLQATHEAVDEQLATLVGADWQKTNNDPAFMKWLNVDDPSSNETRSNAMISAYNAGNSAKVARYFNQFRAEQDANSIVVLAQTDIPSRVKAAFWPSEEALPPLIIMGLLGLAFVVVIFKSIPRRISILRPMYWWNCPIARTGYLLRQLLIASFCFVVIILCVFAHDLYLIVIPIFLMFWCGLCSTLNRFQDIGMSRWHVFGILGAALLSAACEHTIQPDGNQGAAAALRVLFGVPGLSYFLILHFRPSAQIGPASRGIHGPEPQTMEHGLSTSGQTG
jgi:hypothetical protein